MPIETRDMVSLARKKDPHHLDAALLLHPSFTNTSTYWWSENNERHVGVGSVAWFQNGLHR